jgi:hypothetical protein
MNKLEITCIMSGGCRVLRGGNHGVEVVSEGKSREWMGLRGGHHVMEWFERKKSWDFEGFDWWRGQGANVVPEVRGESV